MNTKAVIYPGTFDPITLGHLDIITRASQIFPCIILGVASNIKKNPLFSLKERVNLARQSTAHLHNIKVIGFNDLLVNFAKAQNIDIIIHGIRTISDFEYQLKLAKANQYLFPKIENLFLMSSKELSFVSSSLVKEIAFYNGNIRDLLPTVVYKAILKKNKLC